MSVENGLTLTNSFSPVSTIASGAVARTQNAVFAVDFTGLVGSSGGLIYEQGAVANGSYVGFRANGDFVVRSGTGGTPWQVTTAYLLVPAASAPSGSGTLVWEFAVGTPGTVRAWWNGSELTGTGQSANFNSWAGSDAGGYFLQSASIVIGEFATAVPYATASDLRYYQNQLVIGGTTVTAGTGSVTYAGQGATVTAGAALTAGTGAASYAGQQATVTAGAVVAAGTGAVAYQGQQATVSDPITVTAGTGAVAYAGQGARVVTGGDTAVGGDDAPASREDIARLARLRREREATEQDRATRLRRTLERAHRAATGAAEEGTPARLEAAEDALQAVATVAPELVPIDLAPLLGTVAAVEELARMIDVVRERHERIRREDDEMAFILSVL
jgi:hypothetical protein